MSASNIPIKCTRCRHSMTFADLVPLPRPRRSPHDIVLTDHACPRCGCRSYYDCTPLIAWCWASGLIEIGATLPPDGPNGGGAIEVARGPAYALKGRLGVVARHGQGASAGRLLVPGVPEADNQRAKGDALGVWLTWCGRRKSRDGVIFARAVA